MTREETKEFVRHNPSLRDKADNWNWLIDKIYNDHEETTSELMAEVIHQADKVERLKAQLKAKNEEIEGLKSELKYYKELASDLDDELREAQYELSDLRR